MIKVTLTVIGKPSIPPAQSYTLENDLEAVKTKFTSQGWRVAANLDDWNAAILIRGDQRVELRCC